MYLSLFLARSFSLRVTLAVSWFAFDAEHQVDGEDHCGGCGHSEPHLMHGVCLFVFVSSQTPPKKSEMYTDHFVQDHCIALPD